MKKIILSGLFVLLFSILLCGTVFGAEIISAECNKHGVMLVEGVNIPDEVFNVKFIATGDTKEILINNGQSEFVFAKNPYGNLGKDEYVGLESGDFASSTPGTRVFTFKAVGYDGSVTPYDKQIVLECYTRDGKGLTILSVETDKTVIKELVAGHDDIEKLQFTIATTIDVRDLIAINEKGEVIKDIFVICSDRGYCDIIDGVKYWHFYFISPIVGERSFTFYATDPYYNKRGEAFTVNYTTLSDSDWHNRYGQDGLAGSGTQPGTDEGFSSGDDANATGNEDGVENGGKGQSDLGNDKGLSESSKDEENKKENNNNEKGGSGDGNCCKPEEFISVKVPSSSKTFVVEFPDGTKYNAVDQEEKNLAKSETSDDGKETTWDIWIGSEYEKDDIKITVYDENYNPNDNYTFEEVTSFSKEEIEKYNLAIENEIRIRNNPEKIVITLAIYNKWMIVNEHELVEIDPGRGTTPVIIDGRTMLPVRAIVETLGGKISWDESQRRVQIEIFNRVINFYIDSLEMTWDNIPAKIDVAPQIINGRTMLPIRYVAEVLDHTTVEWDGQSGSVTITYNY